MQNFKNPLDLAESLGKEEKETEAVKPTEKVDEPKDWNTTVDDLIADEQEAIDAYNEALEVLKVDAEKNAEKIKVLEEIKAEEEEHIVKLNALKPTPEPTI